jgi:hypothetical protein
MQYALSRLNVTGAATFGGGSTNGLLTNGVLTTSGRFTQDGTHSPNSFYAVGEHLTQITSNYPGGNMISFGTPQASAFFNLRITVPMTFATDLLIFNDFTNEIPSGTVTTPRLAVQGTYSQTTNVTFRPRRFVFYGPAINATNGFLQPDTVEFRQNPISFVWPVGARYTWNHVLMNFSSNVTLGATAPSPASLNISDGTTLNLNNQALTVNGTFTSANTQVYGQGTSARLQARQFQITDTQADNVQLVLDEAGVPQAQQIDNVTFQNYPATNARLLDITAAGAAGPRAFTFTGLVFPTLPVGAGNRYITTTSSNGSPFQATMAGSNVSAANGPTFTVANSPTSVIWP